MVHSYFAECIIQMRIVLGSSIFFRIMQMHMWIALHSKVLFEKRVVMKSFKSFFPALAASLSIS